MPSAINYYTYIIGCLAADECKRCDYIYNRCIEYFINKKIVTRDGGVVVIIIIIITGIHEYVRVLVVTWPWPCRADTQYDVLVYRS